ncbi:MAG: hypothetical protein IKW98_10810 [Prevotella sp.]|nr:hypothetical protein [Prevotella sp.]
MNLPEEFQAYTRTMMGQERFATFIEALQQEPPTSIRLNPAKALESATPKQPVAWCRRACFLDGRPNFTFDPLFHAGLYYVQESSSMFLDLVLQQHLTNSQHPTKATGRRFSGNPNTFLDLCAAPGGKSTLIFGALPEGSLLVCNEPNRQRAQVLSENMQKWLLPTLDNDKNKPSTRCIVTNNLPADFRKERLVFDAILCDVPCSGEGMFRKDPTAIGEWSAANVEKCARLQREIVSDAWHCLAPGGLFVYSTCTFNLHENEENIQWLIDELEAQPLSVDIPAEWNITGSLLPSLDAPVYRFIPGFTPGEGLFMAVLRKKGEADGNHTKKTFDALKAEKTRLNILPHLFIKEVQEALDAKAPTVDVSYPQAIAYLRREAITLPAETPRGIVIIAYEGHPLGIAKNVGNRANNLYPKPWRILSTHTPETLPKII